MNIIIFTDGACANNGKIGAKGGSGVHFPNGEFADISCKCFGKQTNQRAELYAVYKALAVAKNKYNNVIIYTDSKYVINCLVVWYKGWQKNGFMTKNKKSVKNKDILDMICNIGIDGVKFIYTAGHNNDGSFEGNCNKKADELAKDGINKIET